MAAFARFACAFATLGLLLAQAPKSVSIVPGKAARIGRAAGIRVPISIEVPPGLPQPAALSWTLKYSAPPVIGVVVVPGPAAEAAHKRVVCGANNNGLTKCLLYGVNRETLSSGVIAFADLKTGPQASGVHVEVTDAMAVSLSAAPIPSSASNSTISIQK
jgi:hypothetical protein